MDHNTKSISVQWRNCLTCCFGASHRDCLHTLNLIKEKAVCLTAFSIIHKKISQPATTPVAPQYLCLSK